MKTIKEKITGVINRGVKRKAGEQQLIVAIVMIAIAVGLLFIFRDKVNTMVGDFMTAISNKINSALGTL